MRFTLEQIKEVIKKKGYEIFSGARPYNLNIVGVRSADKTPNIFNDAITCFYTDEFGNEAFHVWPATTDPGLYYLEHPANVEGTAILCEGQYKGVYALDFHHGSYIALCQRHGVVKVIRDFDRDKELDYSSGKTEEGMFGINIHRAMRNGKSELIGKWSAGCQVFQNDSDFNELIELANKSNRFYGNQFTYTLINEKDFPLPEPEALPAEPIKKGAK
jgi:hypothetical protein